MTRVTLPPAAATADVVERLHKVEGQVRGIARMVERGQRRIDVLTQVAAARAALAAVGVKVVDAQVRDVLTADDLDGERAAAQTVLAVHRLLGCHTSEGVN